VSLFRLLAVCFLFPAIAIARQYITEPCHNATTAQCIMIDTATGNGSLTTGSIVRR